MRPIHTWGAVFILLLPIFSLISEPAAITASGSSFSPNWDGSKDYVEFAIESDALGDLIGWKLEILAADGSLVRSYGSDGRRKRRNIALFYVFSSDNEYADLDLEIPEKIMWPGTDQWDQPLPDANYRWVLSVQRIDSKWDILGEGSVRIDTVFPEVEVVAPERLLRKDINRNSIAFYHKYTADRDDKFRIVILDSQQRPVRTQEWNGSEFPRRWKWEGETDTGSIVPEGIYTYELTVWDNAGNQKSILLDSLTVSESKAEIDAYPEQSLVSNSDDSKFRELRFFLQNDSRQRIQNYFLEIYKGEKEEDIEVFTYAAAKGNLDKSIVCPLRNSKGEALEEGTYKYRLRAITNDSELRSISKTLVIKNQKYDLDLSTDPGGFTPDGDGEKDRLVIEAKGNSVPLQSWKLKIWEILEIAGKEKRTLIKSWEGNTSIRGKMIWSGYSDHKILIGSLSNFLFEFESEDIYGRKTHKFMEEFSSGLLVLNEKGALRLSVPESVLDTRWLIGNYSELLSVIHDYPGYKVEVQSHTDLRGDDEVNLVWSETRAKEIFEKLFGETKAFDRYEYRGYGEVHRLHPAYTDYAFTKNRRIDIYFYPKGQ